LIPMIAGGLLETVSNRKFLTIFRNMQKIKVFIKVFQFKK